MPQVTSFSGVRNSPFSKQEATLLSPNLPPFPYPLFPMDPRARKVMKGGRAGAQALGVIPHLSRAHPIPQDRPLLAPVTLRMSGGVPPGWGPMLSWSKWVRPPAELDPAPAHHAPPTQVLWAPRPAEGRVRGGWEGRPGRTRGGRWGPVVKSQASFRPHPWLRPKGKQVYLDSRQGTGGWPRGAGLGLPEVGMWREACFNNGWQSGPGSC